MNIKIAYATGDNPRNLFGATPSSIMLTHHSHGLLSLMDSCLKLPGNETQAEALNHVLTMCYELGRLQAAKDIHKEQTK